MAIEEKKNLTVIRKNGMIPLIPFLSIKEKILGKSYTLTLVFCTPQESREKNKTYRDKDYATNILSFPLDTNNGEIYISLSTARRDAKTFDMTYQQFLHLLVIHGALHLKGHLHSSTMEEQEDILLSHFYHNEKITKKSIIRH